MSYVVLPQEEFCRICMFTTGERSRCHAKESSGQRYKILIIEGYCSRMSALAEIFMHKFAFVTDTESMIIAVTSPDYASSRISPLESSNITC